MLTNLTESPNLILIQNDLAELKVDVAKHHKVLIEGNGDIPLVEKVRNHEAFINDTKYWLKLVIGAVILQTITVGTAAIIWFTKLSPVLDALSRNP
jgi:hypothetical protein